VARPQYTLEKLVEIHAVDPCRLTPTETNLMHLAKQLKPLLHTELTPGHMCSIRSLKRHAITLHRLYEAECNGCTRDRLPWESYAQYDAARELQMEWVEKRIKAMQKLLRKHATSLGLHIYFQTDPRGCPVYVSNCPMSDQNYHTNGVAV
jgi:hypothetical protein